MRVVARSKLFIFEKHDNLETIMQIVTYVTSKKSAK